MAKVITDTRELKKWAKEIRNLADEQLDSFFIESTRDGKEVKFKIMCKEKNVQMKLRYHVILLYMRGLDITPIEQLHKNAKNKKNHIFNAL